MFSSELLPFAKEDISEAASWYNSKQKVWVSVLFRK